MTRDDIIRMAEKAGWTGPKENVTYVAMLERFAALVAAAEREACAKVCEPQEDWDDPLTAYHIAAAIRAREEQ